MRGGALGPADRVTLVRVGLACVVAAFVAHSFVAPAMVAPLVGIATVALALDAVDGPVARRTGTASAFGARFDGEADAFLILVLSVYVAAVYGAWVLAIGAARYVFGAAGWVLPWLRRPLPFRYWRKVVTAVQGIVLVVAAADVAPRVVTVVALLVALALLAESFGRDVAWLWSVRKVRHLAVVEGRAREPRNHLLGEVVSRLVAGAPRTSTTVGDLSHPRSREATRAARNAARSIVARGCSTTGDERAAFDEALERARRSAYEPGEFVGQESFMRAGEIRELAVAAGVGPGVSVLDLCCGVAGPGRFLTAELGSDYLGVDSSPSAIEIARARTGGLPCRFEAARVPPLPAGRFDVVLLFETLLAFPDKAELLSAVSSALRPGGRFACTVEEGRPLTHAERAAMPDADTVWPVPEEELLAGLARAGFRVTRIADHTAAHREIAEALTAAFEADRPAIAARLGERAVDELLDAHRLWSRWLGGGRVRKLAVVAERVGSSDTLEAEHDPAVERAHLD